MREETEKRDWREGKGREEKRREEKREERREKLVGATFAGRETKGAGKEAGQNHWGRFRTKTCHRHTAEVGQGVTP